MIDDPFTVCERCGQEVYYRVWEDHLDQCEKDQPDCAICGAPVFEDEPPYVVPTHSTCYADLVSWGEA